MILLDVDDDDTNGKPNIINSRRRLKRAQSRCDCDRAQVVGHESFGQRTAGISWWAAAGHS